MELDKRFREKSAEEHKYTSTGIKFWRHRRQMDAYRAGENHTVISTHISPEGACNLSCPYCSVSKRKRQFRIAFDTIRQYVKSLKRYGLKAVILTGGGEPTLYPEFNELVLWLAEEGLSVALITNGTHTEAVLPEVWKLFAWVRVSLNFFEGWRDVIKFPRIDGVLGASMVYTGQSVEELRALSSFVPNEVQYIRVLPNCLQKQSILLELHKKIELVLQAVGDRRFFQQFKIHGMPVSHVCHQAYFRPYLSEVDGGTVFPCDSLVLNHEQAYFNEKYAICKAGDIEAFLNHTIKMTFDPVKDCEGCVFSSNIQLLEEWKSRGVEHFDEYKEEMMHEDFV